MKPNETNPRLEFQAKVSTLTGSRKKIEVPKELVNKLNSGDSYHVVLIKIPQIKR